MKIHADLDPKTVWAVTETAERLGISNSELLERRLAGLRYKSTPQRIRELHARRFCDADIAAELSVTVGYVADVRRRLRLPANRRYPRGCS